MAVQHHIDLLWQGQNVWNNWRERYENIQLGLSGTHLDGVKFDEANFSNANPSGASLILTNLRNSNLSSTNLKQCQ